MNTHPKSWIDDQQRSTECPCILDLCREWFQKLTLTPLENDEKFGGDGGEEDPDVLAHSNRTSGNKREGMRLKSMAQGGGERTEDH